MNKRAIGLGLLVGLLFLLPLVAGATEEERPAQLETDRYVFVPAQGEAGEPYGAWLTVKGRALSAQGIPVEVPALAGAEFALYAPDAEGNMLPWPDAADPSKEATVVSGEAPVFIPLPDNTRIYLKQTTVPEGYWALSEDWIEVRPGQELTIWNVMRGELVLAAAGEDGAPLQGAAFTVTGPEDYRSTHVTGVEGSLTLSDLVPGDYTIVSDAAPADRLQPGQPAQTARVEDARRTEATFAYPEMGSLALRLVSAEIGEDGRTVTTPLAGVPVALQDGAGRPITDEDGAPMEFTTDASGAVRQYLPSGSYRLSVPERAGERFAFAEPEQSFIIEDAKVCRLTMEAVPQEGALRVRSTALRAPGQLESPLPGLSFTLLDGEGQELQAGKTDEGADALFVGLPAGYYQLRVDTIPEAFSLPGSELYNFEIEGGKITSVTVTASATHRQRYLLQGQTPGEDGKMHREPLPEIAFEVWAGEKLIETGVTNESGYFALELPMGEYDMHFPEGQAALEPYLHDPQPFSLPQTEAVVLGSAVGRALIQSVDAEGRRLTGASYRLTRSGGGLELTLATDERGEVVTPALESGPYQLESITSPAGYAEAAVDFVLGVDRIEQVEVLFPAQGTLRLTVLQTAIDEDAQPAQEPRAGQEVQLFQRGGFAGTSRTRVLADETLTTDSAGLLRDEKKQFPSLPEGEYLAVAEDAEVTFAIQNEMRTEAGLLLEGDRGALRLTLRDSTGEKAPLSGARLLLSGLTAEAEATLLTDEAGEALALSLPRGTYRLTQLRAPRGYGLMDAIEVEIAGGELRELSLQNHREATLAVEKEGVSYDLDMQEHSVALSGEYALYTKEGDQYLPYPGAEEQLRLMAGEAAIAVPAAPEGTTYYLRETTAPEEGYLPDAEYHEIRLVSGQQEVLRVRRAANSGYFQVRNVDAAGAALSGARFGLFPMEGDQAAATPALLATIEGGQYRNSDPLPAGQYRLRLLEAAPSHQLEPAQQQEGWPLEIFPHSPQQRTLPDISIESAAIPEALPELALPALEGGLVPGDTPSLRVRMEDRELVGGVALSEYALEIGALRFGQEPDASEGIPWQVDALTISAASDGAGPLDAEVWVRLWRGGWQYYRTVSLERQQSLDFADLPLAVREARVVFLRPATGVPMVDADYTGCALEASLSLYLADAAEATPSAAQAFQLQYRDESGELSASAPVRREAEGELIVVPALVREPEATLEADKGAIRGNARELLPDGGSAAAQGIPVRLEDAAGGIVAEAVSDSRGGFALEGLEPGVYRLSAELSGDLEDVYEAAEAPQTIQVRAGEETGAELPLTPLGRITGHVWMEQGLLDGHPGAGDAAAEGVRLRAVPLAEGGQPGEWTTPGADGAYALAGLPLGEYRLEWQLPEGLTPMDSARLEQTFLLDSAQRYATLELPLLPATTVSGRVFRDADGDGGWMEGEQGLAGAEVWLLEERWDDARHEVASHLTGEDGAYAFTGLLPGAYRLEIALPEGMVRIDPEGAAAPELGFTLIPGQTEEVAPIGASRPQALTGYAWMDDDGDGLRGESEPPVSGMTVRLHRAGGESEAVVATTETQEDGGFTFAEVLPGDYRLRFSLPGDAVVSRQAEGGNVAHLERAGRGFTEPFHISMDEDAPVLPVGLTEPIELTVFAWEDMRFTGTVRRNSKGIEGVTLELLRNTGDELRSIGLKQTDSGGSAVFEALSPGEYVLRYRLPEGIYPSRAAAEGEGVLLPAQWAWEATGESRPFALTARQQAPRLTFALMPPASIAGMVWEDRDDNGLRDEDEPGFAGARVQAVDGDGQVALETESDAEGNYLLSPLLPGAYTVRFELPEGHAFSGTRKTYERGTAARSDGHTSETIPFTLRLDTPLENINAGALALGGLSGAVREAEGASAGLAGVRVTLERDQNGRYTTEMEAQTGADGAFALSGIRPGAYRLRLELPGAYVWTTAREGAQVVLAEGLGEGVAYTESWEFAPGDTRELPQLYALVLCGIEGAAFDDTDGDGLPGEGEPVLRDVYVELLDEADSVVASATTGRDGAYAFTGLMPGSYLLRVTLPEGRVFTKAAAGGNRADRVDAQTTTVGPFTLAMGQMEREVWIGALRLATVSGTVYLDANDDGVWQAAEEGLPGAQVLLRGAGSREEWEAVTDVNGAWELTGLEPGEYSLRVTLPEGHVFAREGQRKREGPRIGQLDAAEGESESFPLAFGERLGSVAIGAVRTGDFSVLAFDDAGDTGLHSADARGVAGVAFVATDIRSGASFSGQTDSEGRLTLSGLRPGQYTLTANLPEGRLFSRQVEGGSPFAGTDAREKTVEPVQLAMGQSFAAFEIGSLEPVRIEGTVFLDENRSGALESPEAGLGGVLVEVYYGEELRYEQRTGADGTFRFEGLRPGDVQLRLTLPEQAMFGEGQGLWVQPLEPLGTLGESAVHPLPAGASMGIQVPVLLRGGIAGAFFEDSNNNGLYDLGEPPLADGLVQLIEVIGADQQQVATQLIDEQGAFAFTSLPPGNYLLRFTLPAGYLYALPGEGGRGSVALDQGEQVALSPQLSLGMGESIQSVMCGAIQPGLVGDTVWLDENGNGLQDDGEPPVEGVGIILYRVDEGEQQEIGRVESDYYGFYRFDGLRPGRYRVDAYLPEGYAFTQALGQLAEIDSDIVRIEGVIGRTEEFEVPSAGKRRDIDIGLVLK